MIRRAIILAAGRGARLSPHTDDRPKCLLQLGAGTLLSRQFDACVAVGIDDIVVITGYEFVMMEDEITRWLRESGAAAKVSTVYNPYFATTNNMFSLWVARHRMDVDFVVLNADNVFSHETLRSIAHHGQHPILVPVAQRDKYDAEDMKVRIEDGRITAIAKTIPLDQASGESLGIRAFSGVGRRLLMDELEAMGRDSDPATAWYITAVERIAQRGGPVGVLFLDSNACMDVDFEQDLERARRDFA
ncbi:MAG: phosphocholine cytidylyltransferase family protein [Deltaproteobacteria bacterium]|nr:phosphocholine cytidylyltransferase family protein [Deltaproteobacteria bacterium]